MSDVARLAGVSAQTVSRVLSAHPNVNSETRRRVQAAVEETGYRRNARPRAMITGRSNTIGVVTHRVNSFSIGAILHGVHTAADADGYATATFATAALSGAAIVRAVRRLLEQGVDGLIIAVPLADDGGEVAALTRNLPTVALDGMRGAADRVVAVDQRAAGRLATRHLLDLGHRTVWHVSGPSTWNDANGRARGWGSALVQAGAEMPPPLHGDWSPESGYRHGLALGRREDVTAVFVACDEMAFGLLRGLAESGRRVPEDVSVVGMDDIALAAYCTPPLTTVRQPFHQIGLQAVQEVLALIGDEESAGEVEEPECWEASAREPGLLAPSLVVRASTGRPGSGSGDGAGG